MMIQFFCSSPTILIMQDRNDIIMTKEKKTMGTEVPLCGVISQ
jgi:hypothetical protein